MERLLRKWNGNFTSGALRNACAGCMVVLQPARDTRRYRRQAPPPCGTGGGAYQKLVNFLIGNFQPCIGMIFPRYSYIFTVVCFGLPPIGCGCFVHLIKKGIWKSQHSVDGRYCNVSVTAIKAGIIIVIRICINAQITTVRPDLCPRGITEHIV